MSRYSLWFLSDQKLLSPRTFSSPLMSQRPLRFVVSLFILLVISGCTAALPIATPKTEQSTSPPVRATTPAPNATPGPTSPTAPAATTTPTTIPLPAHPQPAEALSAGLLYVSKGFKLKMPSAKTFQATPTPEMSSVTIEQALASGPWLVVIGQMAVDESGRGYRPIIISNAQRKETQRWWGQVDEAGLASSVVFTGMPRPKSTRIKGMMGTVTALPAGSAYARYFENEQGERFGIASNNETISQLLPLLRPEDGPLQVWGELRYGVNAYWGRRILVRKYDLPQADPQQILARAAATPTTTDSSESDTDLGPIATLLQPPARAILNASVQILAVVEHPSSQQLVVRAEDAHGQVLGQAPVTLDDQNQVALVLPFTDPPSLSHGRIAIYQAEDDLLLGWQQVRFAGPVNGQRVSITQPAAQDELCGKTKVMGNASGLLVDTLLVQIEDTAGVIMGKSQVQPGPDGLWQTTIKCRRPKTARPGVVAVYALSPDKQRILLAIQPIKLKK